MLAQIFLEVDKVLRKVKLTTVIKSFYVEPGKTFNEQIKKFQNKV